MLYFITALSLLFFGIGFLITKSNAKYTLAGYNTMTPDQQAMVDIKSLVKIHRFFHIFLSISYLAFGCILILQFGSIHGGIFLVVYPILAYIAYLGYLSKHSIKQNKSTYYLVILVLLIVLFSISAMFFYTLKENQIIHSSDAIEITGMYGEIIALNDIKSVRLIPHAPTIKRRAGGFAMGAVKKGDFQIQSGEKAKLFLNDQNEGKIIEIVLINGTKIYYSTASGNTEYQLQKFPAKLVIN